MCADGSWRPGLETRDENGKELLAATETAPPRGETTGVAQSLKPGKCVPVNSLEPKKMGRCAFLEWTLRRGTPYISKPAFSTTPKQTVCKHRIISQSKWVQRSENCWSVLAPSLLGPGDRESGTDTSPKNITAEPRNFFPFRCFCTFQCGDGPPKPQPWQVVRHGVRKTSVANGHARKKKRPGHF